MAAHAIKLKREEVMEKIGDNFGGTRYGWFYALIVQPNGKHRIASVEGNRAWNPWDKEDYVAPLPAPFGDGSGEMCDLAETMLKDIGRYDEAKELAETKDRSLVDVAIQLDKEGWGTYITESLWWYAEEWLSALNGDFNDLGIDAPFGTKEVFEPEHDIEIVECPFTFKWAERKD